MTDLATATIRVSIAELVDRVSILRIKIRHSAAAHLEPQLQQYLDELDRLGVIDCAADQQRRLDRINRILWRLESEIRRCEADRKFGPRFICASRMIRRMNDRRAATKAIIDALCRSAFADVKTYTR